MNYTIEMFREDFPKLGESCFYSMKFRYAIAKQDMYPWDGDWANDRDAFMFTFARVGGVVGGGRQFVYKMNCHQRIKKNEVFICATNGNGILHSAVRSTGIMTIPPIEKNYKRRDGKDQRIASYLTRKRFKKERPIWDWFNEEMDKVQKKAQEVTQELNNSFHYIDFDSNDNKAEYLFKASKKRIKTEYGLKNGCYKNNFKLNLSPYDGIKYHSYDEVKKSIDNYVNFRDAKYPLYRVEHNGHTFLFEKDDFEYIENMETSKIEVEYVNKWEDALIALQKQERALKRWRDRAMASIKDKVYSALPEYGEIKVFEEC